MELSQQDISWAKETIGLTGLFADCTPEELSELYEGLEKEHFRSDATILMQGEISSRLCLVQTGTVAVIVRKGKDKTKVAQLETGGFFGEISLLTPRAATATVKAETGCDIIFLCGEAVQALVKKNPALAALLNKKIEERLQSHQNIKHDEH